MTEASQTIRPRHQIASLVVLILDVIGLLLLLFCCTVVVAKFRRIFDDLLEGQALPVFTHVVLSIPAPVYVLCIVGAIAGLIRKESRISDKDQTLVINILAFIAAFFLFMVLVGALFCPIIVVIGGMNT